MIDVRISLSYFAGGRLHVITFPAELAGDAVYLDRLAVTVDGSTLLDIPFFLDAYDDDEDEE